MTSSFPKLILRGIESWTSLGSIQVHDRSKCITCIRENYQLRLLKTNWTISVNLKIYYCINSITFHNWTWVSYKDTVNVDSVDVADVKFHQIIVKDGVKIQKPIADTLVCQKQAGNLYYTCNRYASNRQCIHVKGKPVIYRFKLTNICIYRDAQYKHVKYVYFDTFSYT